MSRRQPNFEITPDILLRAYSIGLFPMAESREAEQPLLGRARGARRLSARRPDRVAQPRQDGALGRFEVRADRAFRRRDERPAPIATRPGSTPTSFGSTANCSTRGHAHSIEAYQDGELVGGLYGVSLGGGLLRREHVPSSRATPRRSRWSISSRDCGSAAFACSTRNSSRRIWRASARSRFRATTYRRRLTAAIDAPADFDAWPPSEPMRGAQALALALAAPRVDGTKIA